MDYLRKLLSFIPYVMLGWFALVFIGAIIEAFSGEHKPEPSGGDGGSGGGMVDGGSGGDGGGDCGGGGDGGGGGSCD
ncbi:hypothetical protein HBDW_35030 [Herbaspirillum sp. DW155]|uniref:hypothetical protein n=1 Tax=Herbaspirillum sp. DW155 TaxID=3095609 RepID=UPI003087F166|nr:hypothetical protein HBDW_35030 [Herbaspirillum sp. DW155]